MKNSKIQFLLCLLILVLCRSSLFGQDTLCFNYQIEVSAEPTTLYMDIYNATDFGPYTPDVVEWYSPNWGLDFGDSTTVVYELGVNFPPSFEMFICADYEVDGATCTLCEWVFIADVNECEYELDIETAGMAVFGSVINTVHYYPPTDVTWILEGGGGVIGNEPSLFYQFDEVGEYIICAEYSDNILGCEGVICDTIVVDGQSTGDCEGDFAIEYFTEYNWAGFYLYNSNSFLSVDSIGWYINGQFLEYGIQMDYEFPAAGVYTVCAATSSIVNVATGEVCPPLELCIDVEIFNNQQTSCDDIEIYPFVDGNSGLFQVFYPDVYEVYEDSIEWYIDGQFIEFGGAMYYDFLENGVYNICAALPDFVNAATNEICPAQESCFIIEIFGQQDDCEAYFEWQDNGSINDINSVTFANASTGNYTKMSWSFGDGNTSTYSGQDSFEHIYENIGVYNVCLTVFDNVGCQNTHCEIVLVSGTPIAECDYEIEYDALNDSLFIFALTSSTGISGNPLWLNSATGEEYGVGDSIVLAFDDYGEHEVCASYETTGNICWGEICVTVTAQNSECEDTDCVFPGDADHNMIADNYDILPIGLHFGETGLDRPNATIGWYGQPAPDWQISADSANLKHVDTNGDGEIYFDDVDAIEQNYNRTHDGVYAMRVAGAPGLHLEFDLDTIYAAPDTGTIIINADIIMGTVNLPVEGVYGVAFSIGYSADLVDTNTVAADYFMGSWIGDPTTVLQLEKNVVNESVIDFGYSRTDQQNISGFGQIGSVSFVMTDNIIGKLASEVELNFPITNVRAIDNTGEEIVITGSDNNVVVDLGNTTTAVQNPDLSQNINIFPNPTLNTINMTISDLQAQTVTLYNAVGQRVLARQIAAADTQIDVRHLPSGVYLVSVQTEKGIYNQKIIVK